MHPLFDKADRLSGEVINAAIQVHRIMGPGLLESIYERCLMPRARAPRHPFLNQKEVVIEYKGDTFKEILRFDLLVDGCLLVELKGVQNVLPIHKAQLLSYKSRVDRRPHPQSTGRVEDAQLNSRLSSTHKPTSTTKGNAAADQLGGADTADLFVRQPGQRAQRLHFLEQHREEVVRYQPGVGAGQARVVQEIGDDSEVVVCQRRQDVQQCVIDRVREMPAVDCPEPLRPGCFVQGLVGPDARPPGVEVKGQFGKCRVQVRDRGQDVAERVEEDGPVRR